MKKRNFFVLAVVMLSFGLSAVYGFGAAVKSEESEQLPVSKAISPKVVAFKVVAAKTASTKVGVSKAVASKTASTKVEGPKAAAPEARSGIAEMTKEEMLAALKEDLANTSEIFNAVPELRAVIGQDGKAVYTFNGAPLESLSKEDMANLFSRVRHAIVKIRTDRIQKQLEITKQVERLRVITSPKQPPYAPVATPSVPKIPSSPPATSQRR